MKYIATLGSALFWAAICFISFAHLDTLPIMIWDESRLAVSTYEMLKSGNYLLPTYDGSPEMWSVKPPFMLWCQMFFSKIIGYDILAIRLPSALAGIGTAIILFTFLRKHTSSKLFPYLAVGVLFTTRGYIMVHGTRTGDYDAMLILFTTFYCLHFYNYLKFRRNKYLVFVLGAMLLAVMTKSVAGLIFAPFLFLMAIRAKMVWSILRSPLFYLGLSVIVITVVSYYMYREHHHPGFWGAVMKEELGGRFSGAIPGHKHPWYYYLLLMFKDHYYYWLPFLFLGSIRGATMKVTDLQDVCMYCFFAGIYFLLIVSVSGTKLEWYEMPSYPFFAVVSSLILMYIFMLLKQDSSTKKKWGGPLLAYVFVASVYVGALITVLPNFFQPKPKSFEAESFNISYFLKDHFEKVENPEMYDLVHDGYFSHVLFYKYVLQDKGIELEYKIMQDIKVGDHIIVHQGVVLDFINEKFELEEKGHFRNVKLRRIIGEKKEVTADAN